MVRFGKNGSDATSGAVRLARYITRRDHVACCGYHGYQDWYIGTPGRNGGVPSRIAELTHPFEYNNLESLQAIFERYPSQIACVIMEPVNKDEPKDSFLNWVRSLCHRNGVLFILDEVITGFRLAKGGAQEYYKIDADLVCLGKAIANGYPLSAIAGKAEYMRHMTDIHYSFTYSGDCIALAAAKATLRIIEREDVPERLNQHGSWLIQQFQLSLKKYGLADWVTISGTNAWPHIQFIDPKMRQLFRQAMAHHGALILDTLNLCYDLTCESLAMKQKLGEAIDKSFGFVAAALDQGVDDYLKWPVPTGIFKIR
jgi:glutamate-1-semialdehyde 2,1-aminomutase